MPVQPGIDLTKKTILSLITEEQIFEKYLEIEPIEGINYINPLRLDRGAGCRFYYNNQGRLKFKDFAKGYNWDCFNIVQYRYNLTFPEALKKIVKDFSLNSQNEVLALSIIEREIKEREKIRIAIREWEEKDLAYWKQYNIDIDTLRKYNVHPCRAIWTNNEYYKCKEKDPCYCYYFGDNLYKLYFPYRDNARFFQNISQVNDSLIQGYHQLNKQVDHCIITKSFKDVLSLSTFDINSGAVLSETHVLKQEQIDELKQKYKHVFTLFDNDSTGRKLAIKYKQLFNIDYLMFPFTMEKDFSDNVKVYSVEKMQNIINNLWID